VSPGFVPFSPIGARFGALAAELPELRDGDRWFSILQILALWLRSAICASVPRSDSTGYSLLGFDLRPL
jgi:hypothetical protein